MVTLVKKLNCGHNGKRVHKSWHIGNNELWNQARGDIKDKIIKSKENYLRIGHYCKHMIAPKIQARTIHLQLLK